MTNKRNRRSSWFLVISGWCNGFQVVKPSVIHRSCCHPLEPSRPTGFSENTHMSRRSLISAFRNFCFCPPNLDNDSQVPAAIDYRSLLQEDEFHWLSSSTIHDLQEKSEQGHYYHSYNCYNFFFGAWQEYSDVVQIDGFNVDYGNEVLTLKLGALGTYVLNKQIPNRQIWLSSPVSGPSQFAWDQNAQAWVYRRTKANLLELLEDELEQLSGEPIDLSSNSWN